MQFSTFTRRARMLLVLLAAMACSGSGRDTPSEPSAPVVATTVALSSDSLALTSGATAQLTAVARSASGVTLTDRVAAWTSHDTSIATVDAHGLVTAMGKGTTTITVTIDGQSAACTVRVNPPPGVFQIVPATAALAPGDSLQLAVQYTIGGVSQPTQGIIWSSSRPLDLTVDSHGHVHADGPTGTMVITATMDTLKATASITVNAPTANLLQQIIYTREAVDSAGRLYDEVRTVAMDGTGNARVTPVDQSISSWAPSPDGRSIAAMYSQTRFNGGDPYGKTGAFVVDLVTDVERALVPIMDDPDWSPDGTRIVYRVTTTFNQADLYVVNADGTGARQLTHQVGLDEQPRWSPDGRTIVYAHVMLGAVNTGDLWTINADGSGARQLPVPTTLAVDPVWSPDGTRIAFDDTRNVWTVHSDGTQPQQISGVCPITATCTSGTMPTWSPDGSLLAFGSSSGLVISSADGSSQQTIPVHQLLAGPRPWSPDGKYLIYRAPDASIDAPWPSLFVVDRLGAHSQQITHGENTDSPRWRVAH